jgi:hypothetical protein
LSLACVTKVSVFVVFVVVVVVVFAAVVFKELSVQVRSEFYPASCWMGTEVLFPETEPTWA